VVALLMPGYQMPLLLSRMFQGWRGRLHWGHNQLDCRHNRFLWGHDCFPRRHDQLGWGHDYLRRRHDQLRRRHRARRFAQLGWCDQQGRRRWRDEQWRLGRKRRKYWYWWNEWQRGSWRDYDSRRNDDERWYDQRRWNHDSRRNNGERWHDDERRDHGHRRKQHVHARPGQGDVPGLESGQLLRRFSQVTSWGNPAPNQTLINAVHAAGFNLLRLPVTWGPHLGAAPNYTIDATWMASVVQTAQWAIDAGMYVFVDTHHDGG